MFGLGIASSIGFFAMRASNGSAISPEQSAEMFHSP
jgi:hypothetical protein